ncbi:Lrp/AsnC family transcriptional regulator [Glutamicibacter ectropisis]|uniref:Lrp/AsnC family transcriptional regulator n=1 Tax=Glutamicibacter ectropisis TaxID=3046593 RepID=A0AAU6WD82_9MICC
MSGIVAENIKNKSHSCMQLKALKMTLAEDRELIQALQIAPRASWRALGGALHRSPAALAQRWEEMSEQGLAWCTAVPFGSSGAGVTAFIAQLAEPGAQQALLKRLTQIPEVVSIEVPARHWDSILTVLAPDIEDLMQHIQPRIAALEGLARQETILCTRTHFAGHEWRLNVLNDATVRALRPYERSSEAEGPGMRQGDEQLLPLLVRDGRASVSDIAEELNLHPSTVSRRLNRILSDPRVSLRCDVAPSLVGQPISCQWFCWLPPTLHDAAARALRGFPDLRYCASTTGATNFTFVLWVQSPQEIFEIERQVVERIEGLSLSESSVTFRFVKRMGWQLDELGRRTGAPVFPAFPL